jgi:hypothetical protein
MPRPRTDGTPAARAIRIGKERTSAAGKKSRVRSYACTDGAPTVASSTSNPRPEG